MSGEAETKAALLSELVGDPSLKDAILKQYGADATVEALAKGWFDTRSKLQATRRVPEDGAKPEEIGAFWAGLGTPKESAGYEIPQSAPPAVKARLEALRAPAHAQNMTAKQWKAISDHEVSAAGEQATRLAERSRDWEKKFREKHGDKAEARIGEAKASWSKLMAEDPTAKAAIEESGLDRHYALLDSYLRAKDAMTEDNVPFGVSGGKQDLGVTPEQLRDRAQEIYSSEQWKKRDPIKYPDLQVELVKINAVLEKMGYEQGFMDRRLQAKDPIEALKASFRGRGG